MTEIERKWVNTAVPESVVTGEGERIRQGYVALDPETRTEVRVRERAGRATLTLKAGQGLVRTEVELPIDADHFAVLWELTEGRRLFKCRYRVVLPGGLGGELDVYEGDLSGLRTIEVEFDSEAAAGAFVAPPWFGREVTGSPAYENRTLAVAGHPGA